MRIEKGDAHTKYVYWTVAADVGELVTESGKTLPYSAWIGTVRDDGSIHVWTPAAYVPRGYPVAARALLEKARETLIQQGEIARRTIWLHYGDVAKGFHPSYTVRLHDERDLARHKREAKRDGFPLRVDVEKCEGCKARDGVPCSNPRCGGVA